MRYALLIGGLIVAATPAHADPRAAYVTMVLDRKSVV